MKTYPIFLLILTMCMRSFSGEFSANESYIQEIEKLAGLQDNDIAQQKAAISHFLKRYPIPTGMASDIQTHFEEEVAKFENPLRLYHGYLRQMAEGNCSVEQFLLDFPYGPLDQLLSKLDRTKTKAQVANELGISSELLTFFVVKAERALLKAKRVKKRSQSLDHEGNPGPRKITTKQKKEDFVKDLYLRSQAQSLKLFIKELLASASSALFQADEEGDVYHILQTLRDSGEIVPKFCEKNLFFPKDPTSLKLIQLLQLKNDIPTMAKLLEIPCLEKYFWPNYSPRIKVAGGHFDLKYEDLVGYLRRRPLPARIFNTEDQFVEFIEAQANKCEIRAESWSALYRQFISEPRFGNIDFKTFRSHGSKAKLSPRAAKFWERSKSNIGSTKKT